MKIAYVTMFYTPAIGGVKQVVQELAERYVKDGHEVHVFCSDSDKYKTIDVKEEIINGVHVHRHPVWFKLTMFTHIWPSLLWKLPKYDFDIIHSHVSGHLYVLISGLVAKFKKTPHVHTTHCPWTDAFRPLLARVALFFSYNIFNKLTYYLCDKIIAITPWEIQFVRKYGGKPSQIVVLPNGMDNILFQKIVPNNFRKDHDIPANAKLILFFGRLNITKGPDKLVLAVRKILVERKDVFLVFVGPDEGMKSTVEEMIKDEPNMLLLDPIRDKKKIAEMYQAADVYALPSYREGLPLTLFEAMASGLPIVASPVNGVPYEMTDPENGFLVEYGNIDKWKEKILEALDNKKLAKKMSENNKEKAKNYSWDIIAGKTMNIYKEVMHKY